MGVDNRAVLMVGLEKSKLDLSVLGGDPNDDVDGMLTNYSDNNKSILHGMSLESHEDNGYNSRHTFVGFILKESPDYGYSLMNPDDLVAAIKECNTVFKSIFQQNPMVILISYQW